MNGVTITTAVFTVIGVALFWRAAQYSDAALRLARTRQHRLMRAEARFRARYEHALPGETVRTPRPMGRFRPHMLELLTGQELCRLTTPKSVNGNCLGSSDLGDLTAAECEALSALAQRASRRSILWGQCLVLVGTFLLGGYATRWIADMAPPDAVSDRVPDGFSEQLSDGSAVRFAVAFGALALVSAAAGLGLLLQDRAESLRRDATTFTHACLQRRRSEQQAAQLVDGVHDSDRTRRLSG